MGGENGKELVEVLFCMEMWEYVPQQQSAGFAVLPFYPLPLSPLSVLHGPVRPIFCKTLLINSVTMSVWYIVSFLTWLSKFHITVL